MCAVRAKAWISSVVKMEPIFELLVDELPASDYRRFDKGSLTFHPKRSRSTIREASVA